VKSSSDENQALAARTRKGRRGSPGRRASPEREASPEPRRRRILVRSDVLSVMIMVTMLHSVHTGREGEEGNRHQQQRLMRLQTGFRGRSCWSPPFQVQFPVGGLGWWIAEPLAI
jgi:hypothetical protein